MICMEIPTSVLIARAEQAEKKPAAETAQRRAARAAA